MDSVRNNLKGKQVRITDEEGCNFVGMVEYVDQQRGKIGVNGAIEGHEGSGKSVQLFYKSDVKRIFVFDETQSVFASSSANIKSMPEPKHITMPGGSEYRGTEHKISSQIMPTTRSSDESSVSSGLGESVESRTTAKSDQIHSEGYEQVASGLQNTDGFWKYATVPLPIEKEDKALAVSSDKIVKKESQVPPWLMKDSNDVNTRYSYPANVDTSSKRRRARDDPLTVSQNSIISDSCYTLPTVVSVGPVRSKDLKTICEGIRSLLWPSVTTPPSFTLPLRLYYIDREGDVFEEAISRLLSCSCIGVSMEGDLLGRNGKSSLLVISSEEEVFMFDLLKMGVNAFKWGLYSILGDESKVKVVYDCRQLSDTLYHQYDLELLNIFDTMAGHVVFSNWVSKDANRSVRSLDLILRCYMGIPDEHLSSFKCSGRGLQTETSVWSKRPLPEHMMMDAAKNSMYLLSLASILERAIQLPMERAMEAIMISNSCNDYVARQGVLNPQYTPVEVVRSLPLWRQ